MIPICYAVVRERTSPLWCKAFARGCGGRVVNNGILRAGPVALFGSPVLWDAFTEARRRGRTFYYGDHAYFSRFRYYRITRNALQAEPAPVAGVDTSRLDHLGVRIARWQRSGMHILVCPPDEVFSGLMGFSAADWLSGALKTVRANTDREIRVRDRHAKGKLIDDLTGAHALVTYHSNAAVEALCAGVPVFVTGFGGAKAMGLADLTRIEAPIYPDGRREWAAALANSQWTFDEMADGTAWRMLNAAV